MEVREEIVMTEQGENFSLKSVSKLETHLMVGSVPVP